MTRRERLFALLDGRPVDRTLTGFWAHLPRTLWDAEHVAQAHLDSTRATGSDILKLMNENVMSNEHTKITRLDDISKFRAYTRGDPLFRDQFEMMQRVCEVAQGEYPILATLHGLYASLFHQTGFAGHFSSMGYGLVLFCRERPKEMHQALRKVTDSLLELVDLSMEAGADGILYSSMGGAGNYFTDVEYAEFMLPYELEIYRHIKARTRFDLLHLCKDDIDFARFQAFEPTIVNWGLFGRNPGLEAGVACFPDSIILGGFPTCGGVLRYGSPEDIEAFTCDLQRRMASRRFILGADCTYPEGSEEYNRLSIATAAFHRAQNDGEQLRFP